MKKLIFLELTLLFLATTFQSDNPPGWYQQTLPVNDFINDIFFLDSLNGWVVTRNNGYILKTDNGGDNWDVQLDSGGILKSVQFIDNQTGFVLGNGLYGIMYKTTNRGTNWNIVHDFNPAGLFQDMNFINRDTGWVCSNDFFDGGIFKTTNGGNTWLRQLNQTYEPSHLFFLNKDTGYAVCNSSKLFRTTNGGINWNLHFDFPSGIGDIYFFNESIGIVSATMSYRTTNGGYDWTQSNLGGEQLTFANDSIGWQGWGQFFSIRKTTNGGISWFEQTSPIFNNITVFSSDSLNAWAGGNGFVHTTDGGGVTGISPIGNQIPDIFILNQNYPNPFNPVTVISYQLIVNSYVELTVFDIKGKEVEALVSQKQNAGKHEIQFNGTNLSSGLYFYKIKVSVERKDEIYSETKKMLLIK